MINFIDRPVGSGAAWRRSPHQKSAGEREKRKRREERKRKEEKEKREEKGKKGEESKRERCRPITPI